MDINKFLETSDIEMEDLINYKNQDDYNKNTFNDDWSELMEHIKYPVFNSERKLKIDINKNLESYIDSIFTPVFFIFLLKQINKRVQRSLDKNFMESNSDKNWIKFVSLKN